MYRKPIGQRLGECILGDLPKNFQSVSDRLRALFGEFDNNFTTRHYMKDQDDQGGPGGGGSGGGSGSGGAGPPPPPRMNRGPPRAPLARLLPSRESQVGPLALVAEEVPPAPPAAFSHPTDTVKNQQEEKERRVEVRSYLHGPLHRS